MREDGAEGRKQVEFQMLSCVEGRSEKQACGESAE